MKRTPTKKGTDRRKRTREKSYSPRNSVNQETTSESKESCRSCSKDLESAPRALFVEEEVGRVFCTESCIADYFSPEIGKLEREYFKRLSTSDLSGDEREGLNHLRWVTLQEPDEVWREKTLSGDYRYTMISEFTPGKKKIWCICICLCLRGEPSFLYLAFPTKNSAMVNIYRRGERVELVRGPHPSGPKSHQDPSENESPINSESHASGQVQGSLTDGLADEWTEEETIRAQLSQQRRMDDIAPGEFGLYQSCLEETLHTPDEVWSISLSGAEHLRLYHFIRYYSHEDPGVWYVVVARETDDHEQIEILDAFPTRDETLVERYRTGTQEIGAEEIPQSRVVH